MIVIHNRHKQRKLNRDSIHAYSDITVSEQERKTNSISTCICDTERLSSIETYIRKQEEIQRDNGIMAISP